ncbi:hypothetical protein N1851_001438 [Merluccius polli]|uniref:Uncharacterized protein n=1 Tax=Merluccius polli TaxID=89951 RepID=A0AA47PBN5_MERPO|nr:hypothetical protein N1851_001438 [Merluccius polli]
MLEFMFSARVRLTCEVSIVGSALGAEEGAHGRSRGPCQCTRRCEDRLHHLNRAAEPSWTRAGPSRTPAGPSWTRGGPELDPGSTSTGTPDSRAGRAEVASALQLSGTQVKVWVQKQTHEAEEMTEKQAAAAAAAAAGPHAPGGSISPDTCPSHGPAPPELLPPPQNQ